MYSYHYNPYHRNPNGDIEDKLRNTIKAMRAADTARSRSNDIIINLFQEFLKYIQEEDDSIPPPIESELEPELEPEPELELAEVEEVLPTRALSDREVGEKIQEIIDYYGDYTRAADAITANWPGIKGSTANLDYEAGKILLMIVNAPRGVLKEMGETILSNWPKCVSCGTKYHEDRLIRHDTKICLECSDTEGYEVPRGTMLGGPGAARSSRSGGGLRRRNPLNPRTLQSRLRSYYRNPSRRTRRKIEEMLQEATLAMGESENEIAQANVLIIDLFKEVLDHIGKRDVIEMAPEEPPTLLELEEPEEEIEETEEIIEPSSGPCVDARFEVLKSSRNREKREAFESDLEKQLQCVEHTIMNSRLRDLRTKDLARILNLPCDIYGTSDEKKGASYIKQRILPSLLDENRHDGGAFLEYNTDEQGRKKKGHALVHNWTGVTPNWQLPPSPPHLYRENSWQDHYDRIIDLEYDGAEEWLTPEEVDQAAQRAEEMARIERHNAERDFHDEYLEQQFKGWKPQWYATEPPPDDF